MRGLMAKKPFAVLALVTSGMLFPLFSKAELKVGDRAPDFALPDQKGNTVKLSDFRGKKTVVLAFYIKASTLG
jgi:cytochrome oxidase Cu insertion factor (SCO1/SenC/PrrC family)